MDILSAVRKKAYGGSGHGITESEWKEFRQTVDDNLQMLCQKCNNDKSNQ